MVPQVLKALESPSPKRRIMALQVIRLLELSAQIKDKLLPLIDDHAWKCGCPPLICSPRSGHPNWTRCWPELLNDPTTDVQDAALRAKRRLDRRRKKSLFADGYSAD